MPEIMNLLACCSQYLEPTALRQRCRVIKALLSMSGRVPMRGMARYAGEGGSYWTVQRFLQLGAVLDDPPVDE